MTRYNMGMTQTPIQLADLIHPLTSDDALLRNSLVQPRGSDQSAILAKPVAGVTSDSREVKPGTIFVALQGSHTNGEQYLEEALKKGALAVVASNSKPFADLQQVTPDAVFFESDEPWRALAQLAAQFYGEPGKAMTLIGVTGTNGKTSVTHFIETLLREASDKDTTVGLIGTLGSRVSSNKSAYESTGHTTPMAPELQQILAGMRAEGITHVVMEVSSHALEQHRVAGCSFQVGVFTNLTQDHLDYHRTMDDYREVKRLLFTQLQPGTLAVINADDPSAEAMASGCHEGVNIWRYAMADQEGHHDANLLATIHNSDVRGSDVSFVVRSPDGKLKMEKHLKLQIAGRFGIYNAMAALATVLGMGLSADKCFKALEGLSGVRGRFEIVSKEPFAIVDYAHTPDGLENVLQAAKQVVPEGGRLICVFGCGGDRDATKRPKMGAIADRLADQLVITSDNPRTEDPQQILTDILTGIERFDASRIQVEADRRQAIRRALELSQPNDVVVIAGKGHEDYQILADKTIHFDDREEVQTYLESKSSQASSPVA